MLMPVPTGVLRDIKSSPVLIPVPTGVLRDIKSSPVLMLRDCGQDDARLALLPSLDYQGLHKAITNLLDLLQLVTFGKHGG